MLCIDNTSINPYFNLAAEEYLLKNFSEDVFMLWQNEPSVIVGKHQNVRAEINIDFAKENHLKIARRFSGGGTVFHDLGNLNLTFIETNNNVNFDKFTNEIVSMLSELGIHAQSDKRRAINIDGLKISGSAQCIHKERVMYHATLLFSSDLGQLVQSLEVDEEAEKSDENDRRIYVKSVKSPVTNLIKYLPQPFDIEKFRQYIMYYFLKQSNRNYLYMFSKNDIRSIELLKQEKYMLPEWNFDARLVKHS